MLTVPCVDRAAGNPSQLRLEDEVTEDFIARFGAKG
jgi:hypothetical protein